MSKQKLSLQEQLLKSGLVSAAKAKTIKTDKRKQAELQRNHNVAAIDEAKELAQKAHAEQVQRDRELNQLKQRQEEQKQVLAQVKQLIEQNKLGLDPDGLAYRFNDDNKIKTLYVSESQRGQMISGRLAIVKWEAGYELVSAEVAEKISLRDAASVVLHNKDTAAADVAPDDPYAKYQIPDDLLW